MFRFNRHITAGMLMVAGFCSLSVVAQGDTPASRTVEVRSTKTKSLVETWQRSVNPRRQAVRVGVSGKSGSISMHTMFSSRRDAAVRFEAAGKSGNIVIKGKSISQNQTTSKQAVIAARAALARLEGYERDTASQFGFKVTQPDEPGVKINWDCEKASLNVIVWCGLGQIGKCADAVNKQFCECVAPEDPKCGT